MKTTLEIKQKNKLSKHYAVKGMESKAVQDIDIDKRTVKIILNTSFWIDHDLDMIIPNAVAKSLSDNGVNSNANVKIKHQIDHSLRANDTIGKFTVLDERKINNKEVLYAESYLPETIQSTEHLIKYQTGMYDQHSIGFRYKNLAIADKNSQLETERLNWEEFYPLALNKEIADKNGYFWVVKEYELFEGSVVTYGSNELTNYLGSKSADKKTYLADIFNRLDFLTSLSDSGKKEFKTEILQIKQIIQETYNIEKSIKDTFVRKPLDDSDNIAFLKLIKSNI